MLGRRESLSSQLKKQLLQKIDDKVYLPGQRIPSESDLCAEFGVSRTVVREAVASLRASGRRELAGGRPRGGRLGSRFYLS